jgi:hypothetical protein
MINVSQLITGCGFMTLLALTGCRGDGLTDVAGAVTYDGQPVNKGLITFLPPDGNGPTAASTITNGKYAARIAPGRKRVQIEAYKVTGQQPWTPGNRDGPMVDVQEQILPEHYNTKSELTCEIIDRVSTCDFLLEKSQGMQASKP